MVPPWTGAKQRRRISRCDAGIIHLARVSRALLRPSGLRVGTIHVGLILGPRTKEKRPSLKLLKNRAGRIWVAVTILGSTSTTSAARMNGDVSTPMLQ